MLRIGRLKIRNFKSFKFIDVPLSSNFIALAGPNGSGKSNFTDAIRFVLGEISLRSLRAKRVKDLIFATSEAGEVTLYFEGDAREEVHRAIRKDGKIRYRLNGKKTTRQSILDSLHRYNLDQSGRHVIAQGEVQKIAHMNGKERRAIMDSVAGIADFEDKKKEALRELEVVNTRIKDANLVMGERLAYLEELRVEREQALAYQQAKEQTEKARASLLQIELTHYEQTMQTVLEQEQKIQFNLSNKQTELTELESRVADLEQQRSRVSEELQHQQKTAGLIQKIEELRASVGSKTQALGDGRNRTVQLVQERQTLEKEIARQKKEVVQIEKDAETLQHDLQQAQKQADASGDSTPPGLQELEHQQQALQGAIQTAREHRIALEAESDSKQDILQLRQSDLQQLETELKSFASLPDGESEIAQNKKAADRLAKELDASFARTKELNIQLAELDKQLLEQKEKASVLRLRVAPSLANPALQYLAQLKGKEPGLYGTVAELIEFKTQHAPAVEAAAGSRLLYVVVEDAELATRLIAKLKTQTEGRVTFIPLREVKSSAVAGVPGGQPLVNCLQFSPSLKPAIDFVFGSTLLVDDMALAKKPEMGRWRRVTLGGELFEPSGIITGGKVKTSLLVAQQLRAVEARIAEFQQEKTAIMNELVAIREQESALRSKKAEIEIAIKTIHLQAQHAQEELQKKRSLETRMGAMQAEIRELTDARTHLLNAKEKAENELQASQHKLQELEGVIGKAQESMQEKREEYQRKREERASRISFLQASLEGKRNEVHLRKQTLFNHQERLTQLQQESKGLEEKIRLTEKELSTHTEELRAAEEKIAHKSREIEQLFSRLKGFETELQGFGEKMGRKKLEVERLNRDRNEVDVKKATAQTRLEDLRQEYGPYRATEKLTLPKEQLATLLQESETALKTFGNVNLAAIEMYQKKKDELGEIEQKLQKLSTEREAILKMMEEIELRKREVFFETFHAVADHFRAMFQHLSIGEGVLYLDKPNDPFESGLHIKLRRGNREYPLDSLSGGENSLIALMFIFAMQFFKPSPFYILDEVDAALDKENSKNLSQLISRMSQQTQFLVVTHNDTLIGNADAVLGVTKVDGISRLVGVKLATAAVAH